MNTPSDDPKQAILAEQDVIKQFTLLSDPKHSEIKQQFDEEYTKFTNNFEKSTPNLLQQYQQLPIYYQCEFINTQIEAIDSTKLKQLIEATDAKILQYVTTTNNDLGKRIEQKTQYMQKRVGHQNSALELLETNYNEALEALNAYKTSQTLNNNPTETTALLPTAQQNAKQQLNVQQERARKQIIHAFEQLPVIEQATKLQLLAEDQPQNTKLLHQLVHIAKPEAQKHFLENNKLPHHEQQALLLYLADQMQKEKTPKQELFVRTFLWAGLITGIALSLAFPPAGLGMFGMGALTVIAFKLSDIAVSFTGGIFSEEPRRTEYFQQVKQKTAGLIGMLVIGITLSFLSPAVLSALTIMAAAYVTTAVIAGACTLVGKALINYANNIDAEENPVSYARLSSLGAF